MPSSMTPRPAMHGIVAARYQPGVRRVRSMPGWAVALGLVLIAGAALRARRAADPGNFLSTDERAYAGLGRSLSHGYYDAHGMNDPLHWPPGTPLLFGVARQITGVGDARLDPPETYWAQWVVGVALIVAIFALVRPVARAGPGGPGAGGRRGRGRRAVPAPRDHPRRPRLRAARRADDRGRARRARVGVADARAVAVRRRGGRHRRGDPRARRPPRPAARARRRRRADA